MGCGFCATGQAGYERNLTVGEIVEQVVRAGTGRGRGPHTPPPLQRRVHGHGRAHGQLRPGVERHPAHPRRPRALRPAPDHLDGGHRARDPAHGRRGSAGEPRRVAARRQRPSCATSWCPINRRYPLDVLYDACEEYVDAKHRRLSFEWALIDGVNDRDSDAEELAVGRPPAPGPREPHPAERDTWLADHRITARTGLRLPRPAR